MVTVQPSQTAPQSAVSLVRPRLGSHDKNARFASQRVSLSPRSFFGENKSASWAGSIALQAGSSSVLGESSRGWVIPFPNVFTKCLRFTTHRGQKMPFGLPGSLTVANPSHPVFLDPLPAAMLEHCLHFVPPP